MDAALPRAIVNNGAAILRDLEGFAVGSDR